MKESMDSSNKSSIRKDSSKKPRSNNSSSDLKASVYHPKQANINLITENSQKPLKRQLADKVIELWKKDKRHGSTNDNSDLAFKYGYNKSANLSKSIHSQFQMTSKGHPPTIFQNEIAVESIMEDLYNFRHINPLPNKNRADESNRPTAEGFDKLLNKIVRKCSESKMSRNTSEKGSARNENHVKLDRRDGLMQTVASCDIYMPSRMLSFNSTSKKSTLMPQYINESGNKERFRPAIVLKKSNKLNSDMIRFNGQRWKAINFSLLEKFVCRKQINDRSFGFKAVRDRWKRSLARSRIECLSASYKRFAVISNVIILLDRCKSVPPFAGMKKDVKVGKEATKGKRSKETRGEVMEMPGLHGSMDNSREDKRLGMDVHDLVSMIRDDRMKKRMDNVKMRLYHIDNR